MVILSHFSGIFNVSGCLKFRAYTLTHVTQIAYYANNELLKSYIKCCIVIRKHMHGKIFCP